METCKNCIYYKVNNICNYLPENPEFLEKDSLCPGKTIDVPVIGMENDKRFRKRICLRK